MSVLRVPATVVEMSWGGGGGRYTLILVENVVTFEQHRIADSKVIYLR